MWNPLYQEEGRLSNQLGHQEVLQEVADLDLLVFDLEFRIESLDDAVPVRVKKNLTGRNWLQSMYSK